MTRSSSARRAAAAVTMAALLGLVLAGCTKKVTVIDPRFTIPEGRFVPGAILVTYPTTEHHLKLYKDKDGNGQYSISDTLVAEVDETFDSPANLHGLILDSTIATQYQVYRRETNGTVHELGDFMLQPSRRWLDTHWEAYRYTDGSRSGYVPPTYIGRGIIAGTANNNSPLTNFSSVSPVQITPMYFRYVPWSCPDCAPWVDRCALRVFPRDSVYQPPDTLFAMRWTPVTGAAGYWIQVYDAVGDANQRMLAAQPSQVFLDASHDYLVAFVPAPADSYKIGQPGVTILTRGTLIAHHEYLIRITAVNDDGELVGFMAGDSATVTTAPRPECDGQPCLGRFTMGAVKVSALRPCPPGERCPNPETPYNPPPCTQ